MLLVILVLLAFIVKPCLAQTTENTVIITATEATWFIGSFLGTLVRLLLPLKRKNDQIQQNGWDMKYTGTTILAIILAVVVTGLVFPSMAIPENFGTLFNLFWMAFIAGYGSNAVLIEISEYLIK